MAKKYVLTQTVRANGHRFGAGAQAELLPTLSKDEIADLIEREILVEVPDVGTSVGESEDESNVQIEELEREVAAGKERESTLKSQLAEAKAEASTSKAEATRAKSDAAKAQTELKKAKADLEKAQADLEAAKKPAV